jgi:membrane-associated phospholipid phosphatase
VTALLGPPDHAEATLSDQRPGRFAAVTPLNVLLAVLALLQGHFFTVFLHTIDTPAHVEAIGWDYDIPFLPWTIFFYMSVYVLLVVTIVVFVLRRDPWPLTIFLLAFVLMWGIADFVWSAYPTVDVLRPRLDHSFLDRLVSANYGPGRDTLPSGHSMTAWLCAFSFVFAKIRWAPLIVAWAIAISASTLFVRQHYIVDVVASVGLALVCCVAVERAVTHQLLQPR